MQLKYLQNFSLLCRENYCFVWSISSQSLSNKTFSFIQMSKFSFFSSVCWKQKVTTIRNKLEMWCIPLTIYREEKFVDRGYLVLISLLLTKWSSKDFRWLPSHTISLFVAFSCLHLILVLCLAFYVSYLTLLASSKLDWFSLLSLW